MDPFIKKSISVTAVIIVLMIGWYGTWRPFQKSSLFIQAQQNLANVGTLPEFEKTMSVALDYASPVGQEELVRQTANMIMSTIQSYGQNTELTKALMDYINSYYQPILDRGRGMSFGQDLFLMGIANEDAFGKTKNVQYLLAAQKYYEEANRLGPERPQPLYGLFDVYRTEGNWAAAKKVGEQILSEWPSDKSIAIDLTQFPSSTASKSGK